MDLMESLTIQTYKNMSDAQKAFWSEEEEEDKKLSFVEKITRAANESGSDDEFEEEMAKFEKQISQLNDLVDAEEEEEEEDDLEANMVFEKEEGEEGEGEDEYEELPPLFDYAAEQRAIRQKLKYPKIPKMGKPRKRKVRVVKKEKFLPIRGATKKYYRTVSSEPISFAQFAFGSFFGGF